MEVDLRSFTARKIEELLTHLGISDPQDESIAPHITGIANFVHENRLKAGLMGVPDYFKRENTGRNQEPVNGERGSYRILLNNRKRGQPNYKGLDAPSGKRRSKATERKQSRRPSQNSNGNMTTNGRCLTTDTDSAHPHQCPSEPASGSDRHCESNKDVCPSIHDNQPKVIRSPVLSRAETNKSGSSVNPAAGAPVSGNNLAPQSNNGTADGTRPDPTAAGENISIHCAFPSICSSVMDDILVECVRLNYAIGRYTLGKPERLNKQVCMTADINTIHHYAQKFASLDYSRAMYSIQKDHSVLSGQNIQTRYLESVFWEIIKKGEKFLDPNTLASQMGRPDEFTMAEKTATKRFMAEAGYGLSGPNQQRYRRLWKRLYDLRKVGVDKILLYRTRSLDTFCVDFPEDADTTLVDAILSWEKLYGPEIAQLETRVKRVSEGDVSGRSFLTQPGTAERLAIADPETTWNSAKNEWLSDLEEIEFHHSARSLSASEDEMGGLFDISGGKRNKSIFISLIPKDGGLLSVVPIVSVNKDDILGFFAGHLRYSDEFNATRGIRGPREKLWLDYSQVTGALNLMRVSHPGGDANVRLVWELYDVGDPKPEWRVSVRATREIKAFDEIVRSAEQEAQFLMHQDSACARGGYLE